MRDLGQRQVLRQVVQGQSLDQIDSHWLMFLRMWASDPRNRFLNRKEDKQDRLTNN